MKYFVVFLLLLSVVSAFEYIDPGQPYSLTNVPKCYGDIEVKVDQQLTYDDAYYIIGCTQKINGRWKCSCDNVESHDLRIVPHVNYTNEFDVTAQYYVEPISGHEDDVTVVHSARRTLNFNNLRATYERPKEGFNWPEFPKGLDVVIIIFSIILVVGLFVGFTYLIVKVFFVDDEPVSDQLDDIELEEEFEELFKEI